MEEYLDCRKEEMKESKKRKLSRKLINKMKLTKVVLSRFFLYLTEIICKTCM